MSPANKIAITHIHPWIAVKRGFAACSICYWAICIKVSVTSLPHCSLSSIYTLRKAGDWNPISLSQVLALVRSLKLIVFSIPYQLLLLDQASNVGFPPSTESINLVLIAADKPLYLMPSIRDDAKILLAGLRFNYVFLASCAASTRPKSSPWIEYIYIGGWWNLYRRTN